jgi:hypothetical protein
VTGTVSLCIPCPPPLVLCLLKPVAHVWTLKMAEDGLSVYSASSPGMSHVPGCIINLLSLTLPCLFIWRLGTGGRTWHMESQEFGPWVQNSTFILT